MLQPLSDALTIIRKRPNLYVPGYPRLLGESLSSGLVFDAVVAGAAPVLVDRVGDWWMVGSSVDWFADLDLSVEHLFSHLVATPHVGDNTNRHDVLVAALARGVVVYRDGAIDWKCGDVGSLADLERYVTARAQEWRVVFFLP